MKKEYKTPTMKVVAIRTERLMNTGSDFSLGVYHDTAADQGQEAWGKEENAGDFGW